MVTPGPTLERAHACVLSSVAPLPSGLGRSLTGLRPTSSLVGVFVVVGQAQPAQQLSQQSALHPGFGDERADHGLTLRTPHSERCLVCGVVQVGDDVRHPARLSEQMDLSRLLLEVENLVYRPP